jgi:hypothetical protein
MLWVNIAVILRMVQWATELYPDGCRRPIGSPSGALPLQGEHHVVEPGICLAEALVIKKPGVA